MENTSQPPPTESYLKKLTIFFGLVYFCQVMGQDSGLFYQPLQFFFEKVLHYDEVKTTASMAVLTLPWMIKPLYGLLSDFIPILGYRRKSYLIIMSLLSTIGFVKLTGASSASDIIFAMMLSSIGTAFCDVITDALMVEQGQTADRQRAGQGKEPMWVKRFQSVQWFWASMAAILSGLLGGQLCQRLSPEAAVHAAAWICIAFPLCVLAAAWFWIKEEKSKLNLGGMKTTAFSYMEVFKSRPLWVVVGFLFLWNFAPSFDTPFYRHMEHNLGFSQAFIGTLNTISSVGSVIGAWLFGSYLAGRFPTKKLMMANVVAGTIATLAYLLLQGHASAIVLNVLFGIVSMISNLTVLGLAAEACPKHAEGFTFAALMSVINFSRKGSAMLGSWLLRNVFAGSLTPLIWVSAIMTALAFFVVRYLPDPQSEDEPPAKKE